MGKLPKELREKLQRQKQLRSQGSAAMKAPSASSKNVNRQMRRRMQQQGVEGMDQIEAKKVIIQTDEGDLVINNPQVIKLTQNGMEVYQVIGSANKEPDSGESDTGDQGIEEGSMDNDLAIGDDNNSAEIAAPLNVQITDQDIQLVSMQTGVPRDQAEAALREANGDLARAIISLKTRPQ